MKRIKQIIICCIPLVVAACSNFSTNMWRTEQTAVNTAYAAYTGWTNYLNEHPATPQDVKDTVKAARLGFAGSIHVAESWRQAYDTNSAVKPQAQAALEATLANASNVVWLVTFFKQ